MPPGLPPAGVEWGGVSQYRLDGARAAGRCHHCRPADACIRVARSSCAHVQPVLGDHPPHGPTPVGGAPGGIMKAGPRWRDRLRRGSTHRRRAVGRVVAQYGLDVGRRRPATRRWLRRAEGADRPHRRVAGLLRPNVQPVLGDHPPHTARRRWVEPPASGRGAGVAAGWTWAQERHPAVMGGPPPPGGPPVPYAGGGPGGGRVSYSAQCPARLGGECPAAPSPDDAAIPAWMVKSSPQVFERTATSMPSRPAFWARAQANLAARASFATPTRARQRRPGIEADGGGPSYRAIKLMPGGVVPEIMTGHNDEARGGGCIPGAGSSGSQN